MRDTFCVEEDLASHVAAWIEAQGWEVYREVTIGMSMPRADLCAVSGKWLWVVECKMRFGFDVMAQALDWSRYANAVSVAVPKGVSRNSRGRRLGEQVCRDMGLGLILASPLNEWCPRWGVIAPRLRRTRDPKLAQALHPDQKGGPAGTAKGGYYTPFRGTCCRLRDLVRKSPGIDAKSAIKALDHHYASDTSARAHLLRHVRNGFLDGIRIENGRPPRLYPVVD